MTTKPPPYGPSAPVGELVEYVRKQMDERALRHKVSGHSFQMDFWLTDGATLTITVPWTVEHYEMHRTNDELIRSIGRRKESPMHHNPPAYPGQIILSVSPLEARALRRALELLLSICIYGRPLFAGRHNRDALRRIQRKLKRLSTPL